jgi:hypothetical protein
VFVCSTAVKSALVLAVSISCIVRVASLAAWPALLLALYALAAGAFTGQLAIYHVFLMCIGQTTFDRVHSASVLCSLCAVC